MIDYFSALSVCKLISSGINSLIVSWRGRNQADLENVGIN